MLTMSVLPDGSCLTCGLKPKLLIERVSELVVAAGHGRA
jgi:hypothetical protein